MRKSTILLSIAFGASIASAAWMYSQLREERARNAGLVAQIGQAAKTGRDSAPGPVVVGATATPRAEPTANTPSAAATSEPRIIHGTEAEWDEYRSRLMRDPKYREARREQARLAYAPRRTNLIRLLGLTPAQADSAIDLQLDQEARLNEIYHVEVATDDARFERRARLEALEQAHQDQLRTLLGEEKRARLETYMESRQSRMQVDRLRSELTEANALRDDQVEPLIAALHTERAQMQSDLQDYSDTLSWEGDQGASQRRYFERQAQLMKSMNGRMHSSASSVLTSAQLDALDSMLGREFARFEAQQRVNRIQSKLDRPATPATSSN